MKTKNTAFIDIYDAADCLAQSVAKSAASGKSGKPKTQAQIAIKRASAAYHNAKYRCGKAKGYENTKFVLPPFKEVIAIIGLPKAHESFDRIDPHGHYELSNVRWASAAVQAANKKGLSGGSIAPLAAMIVQARAAHASKVSRREMAELWMTYIATYARVPVPDAERMRRLAQTAGLPADFGNSFDNMDLPVPSLPPGVMHLPALTEPGKLVRMRAGPFSRGYNGRENDHDVDNRRRAWSKTGIIEPFSQSTLEWNVPKVMRVDHISDLRSSEFHGACWVGQPTSACLNAGWFEGWMLAFASRLRELKRHSAVYPAIVALDHWISYKNPQDFSHTTADDCETLYIPDFQVDAGPSWRSSAKELYGLCDLISHRVAKQKKTFLGIQNPNTVPRDVRDFVFSKLNVRAVDPFVQLQHPDAKCVRVTAKDLRKAQGWEAQPFPSLRDPPVTEDMIGQQRLANAPFEYVQPA